METLSANTQIIADALAGYLYNISASDYSAIFSGSLVSIPMPCYICVTVLSMNEAKNLPLTMKFDQISWCIGAIYINYHI